jgi:hypothetical protein
MFKPFRELLSIAGLIAYCHQPKKPSLNIIPAGLPLLIA